MREKYKYQKNSAIRVLARNKINKLTNKKCVNCGYDSHVETCHMKSINSFSLDTPISKVNSFDNLIILCPNCHWELDNGLLKLSSIMAGPAGLEPAT